jgi:predicted nucleic acid-binding protein
VSASFFVFGLTPIAKSGFKKIRKESSLTYAEQLTAQIYKTELVSLMKEIALCAANISLEYDLPMADSIVYATAELRHCKGVTLDNDFHKLPWAEVI